MLPSPTGCFKDKTSVFTAAAFPALESQALQGWGSGGEPPEAWKRTPEKQLPAMWIPVRGWLEGLGRGAVFHPASGLRCFGCDTSHSLTQPFLAPDGHLSKQWAGSHPASINHNAMPCQLHPPISVLPLHHLANPRHDPPPPSHLCPWARMSRTECKGDLVTAQLAILPIQGKPPLCQFSLSGLKYDLWY